MEHLLIIMWGALHSGEVKGRAICAYLSPQTQISQTQVQEFRDGKL